MSRILWTVLLLAGSVLAAPGFADEPDAKRAFFVSAGASGLREPDDFHSGTGLNYGGGVDLYAAQTMRLALKIDMHAFRHGSTTFHTTTGFVTLRILPLRGPVRPYVEVGTGYATSRGSDVLPAGNEFDLGIEWEAAGKTLYLDGGYVGAEEPMRVLRLGVRIP